MMSIPYWFIRMDALYVPLYDTLVREGFSPLRATYLCRCAEEYILYEDRHAPEVEKQILRYAHKELKEKLLLHRMDST